jgi:phenylacetate-CoA ligase
MRKFLAQVIGLSVQDFFRHTRIKSTLNDLRISQNWKRDMVEQNQLEKFKKLLHHAYNTVPYYQGLFLSIGLTPESIKTLDDIELIPILTKDTVRSVGKGLYSSTINKRKVRFGVTGGTTGPPLSYIKDANTRSFVWGAFYRWYKWMGLDFGDPVLVFWGSPEVLKPKRLSKVKDVFLREFENTLYINSFDLNDQTLPLYVEKVIRFKPKLIRGYLSAILQFAYYLDQNRIYGVKPIAISTTTETLLPPYREYLEKIFNAPVYDQYGCGECGSIAFECSEHRGLHINMEHVLVEILNDKNQSIFDKPGRVILTDLDNYAMPLIRYENGDVAIKSLEECTCGVNHHFLKCISGRIKDTIILKDGKRVHGVFFTDILHELNLPEDIKIKRFQVYQKIPGEIEFRIESLVGIDKKFLIEIERAIGQFFHHVDLQILSKLESDLSGKFRYIISENEFI